MPILSAVIEIDPNVLGPVLGGIISRALPEVKLKKESKRDGTQLRQEIVERSAKALVEHHLFVSRWSDEIHALPMGLSEVVTETTIETRLRSAPRRLGLPDGAELSEDDVLYGPANVVVLGDPGAGKTTMLRRLAASIVALGPDGPWDDYMFAVVIVCRERSWNGTEGLYTALGEVLGIHDKFAEELDDSRREIRKILSDRFVVLIDGLDEVSPTTIEQSYGWCFRIGMSSGGYSGDPPTQPSGSRTSWSSFRNLLTSCSERVTSRSR